MRTFASRLITVLRSASWITLIALSAILSGLAAGVIYLDQAYEEHHADQEIWAASTDLGTAAKCEEIKKQCRADRELWERQASAREETLEKFRRGWYQCLERNREALADALPSLDMPGAAEVGCGSFPDFYNPYPTPAAFEEIEERCRARLEQEQSLIGLTATQAKVYLCSVVQPAPFLKKVSSNQYVQERKPGQLALRIWSVLAALIIVLRLLGIERHTGWRRIAAIAFVPGVAIGWLYASSHSASDLEAAACFFYGGALASCGVVVCRRVWLWVSDGFSVGS